MFLSAEEERLLEHNPSNSAHGSVVPGGFFSRKRRSADVHLGISTRVLRLAGTADRQIFTHEKCLPRGIVQASCFAARRGADGRIHLEVDEVPGGIEEQACKCFDCEREAHTGDHMPHVTTRFGSNLCPEVQRDGLFRG